MTLQEALELKAACEREMAEVHGRLRPFSRKDDYGELVPPLSGDLPRDFYVVSQDGADFAVMYFAGEYSDYHESVIRSLEEWQDRDRGWDWREDVEDYLDLKAPQTTT